MFNFLYNFKIYSCPFRTFFHINCPACGMTRAMFSLLRLDFAGYLKYNAMTFPVLLAAILLVVFQKSKVVQNYAIIVLAINFIYYIIRVFVLRIYI